MKTLLLVLLGLLCRGRSELQFLQSRDVTKTVCDKSIRLPCFVINLKWRDKTFMLVKWKFNDQIIYSFDGSSSSTWISPDFSSAAIDMQKLARGNISLAIMNVGQAVVGKYTCSVTEVDQTGAMTLSLVYKKVHIFKINLYVTTAVALSLDVLFFWIHFGISVLFVSREHKPSVKVLSILAFFGIFPTVFVMVGLELLYTYEYSPTSLAGLGIAVIPSTLVLFFLQFFLHPMASRNDVTILVLTTLKAVELVIQTVGCGLCLSACLPKKTGLFFAGLITFAALMFVDLVYSVTQQIKLSKNGQSKNGQSNNDQSNNDQSKNDQSNNNQSKNDQSKNES